MSLQKLGTQLIKSQPLLHVSATKNSDVPGGYNKSNDYAHFDLNEIQYNSINGASLTTRNASDVELAGLTTKGLHGRTDISINNPSSGVNNNKCWVTLPVGKYYIEFFNTISVGSSPTDNQVAAVLNKDTLDVLLRGMIKGTTQRGSDESLNGIIDLASETSLVFSIAGDSNSAPEAISMGTPFSAPTGVIKIVHADVKIYKLD
jgi:hypothetical protein